MTSDIFDVREPCIAWQLISCADLKFSFCKKLIKPDDGIHNAYVENSQITTLIHLRTPKRSFGTIT